MRQAELMCGNVESYEYYEEVAENEGEYRV